MARAPSRIVIVGASLGGGSAIVQLRERGFEGQVRLIGAEQHLPYERPPLSKALMLSERDEPDWVQDADYYAANDIGLLTGTVATAIDRQRGVVMAGGDEHPYDKLLLATGSSPRRLRTPGVDLDGVVTLRTWDDALALRKRLVETAHIVIVGAGWIGCEVAAAKDQGGHVAGNLLGADDPYELRPFFFSDQYDLGCEYRGLADPARDELVVRGDLRSREFTAFWLRDGGVVAAMNVNQWDDGDNLQALVDSGAPLT